MEAAKSLGRKYVQFDTGPVKLALSDGFAWEPAAARSNATLTYTT